jgi:hypothetical protein
MGSMMGSTRRVPQLGGGECGVNKRCQYHSQITRVSFAFPSRLHHTMIVGSRWNVKQLFTFMITQSVAVSMLIIRGSPLLLLVIYIRLVLFLCLAHKNALER